MAVPDNDRTGDGLGAPAVNGYSISPDDNTELNPWPRGLLVGTAGTAKVTYIGGSIDIIPLQQGYNPIRVRKVWSTGTSASDIHALY